MVNRLVQRTLSDQLGDLPNQNQIVEHVNHDGSPLGILFRMLQSNAQLTCRNPPLRSIRLLW